MSYTDSQNIQYKASTGQVNLDQAQGIVECFVAGIGNKDSVGDVCATGAFAKSLLRRKPRVVWGHNWNDPIGKVLEMYEVPPNDPRLPAKMRSAGIGGLYAKVQFNLNSEKGKEAFANVAFFGEEQEWSIGYKTLRAQFDQGSQANILYEVELYEVSPVLHGANQLTGTISVKNADGNTPMVMPAMQGMPNIPEDEVQRKLQEELSLQTGSKVKISSVEDGSVTFSMGEEDAEESYKCRFHNDNGTFMFSTPQRINKPMQMPGQMQPMMPMGMPSRPMVPQNPNQTVVVPQVLPGGMPNQMPLVQIDYVGEDSSSKPQGKPKLVQEEADLAEALIKITKRHGKFNEDANGVWAGYKPAAENMVAKIGVKCSNCVMYEGNGVCKIIALKVEDGGKCRFAVIPEGVVKVSPIKKQEVTEEMQEEEVKWLKEIEDRHPEVFINGDLRHAVKRKRDALVPAVKLTRIGEYSVKSASNEIYYLPVSQEDAFSMKQAIDPIIDYYRAEAYVDDGGIVFTSGVNKDFAEAVNNAVKALGRDLAGRTARAGRGMAARFNPKAWDGDNDGLVQEGTPYQRPAIPGINDFGTRGVVDAARAIAAFEKPKEDRKKPAADRRGLSSGKRDLSRHSNRNRDLEKQFPNAEENAKREAHDKLIDAWEAGMDMRFTTIGRQQDERGGRFSEDFLRGRELGYNDARSRWFGKGTAEQPKDFNEKQKASQKYSSWYRDVVTQLGRGKANRSEDASREQQYAGIDAGMKDFLMSVAPDTSGWAREDRESLAKLESEYGFGRGGLSSGKKPTGEKLVVNSLGEDVPLAERLKEIDEFSTEDLGYEVYEVLTNSKSSLVDDFGWDYLERNHGINKSDYKNRPGDFGYRSYDEPSYDIRQAIEDSMSEDEQRNFLKTSSKLEASPEGGLSSGRRGELTDQQVTNIKKRLAALESAVESGDEEAQKELLKKIFKGKGYQEPFIGEQFGREVLDTRPKTLGRDGNSPDAPDKEITDEDLTNFIKSKFESDAYDYIASGIDPEEGISYEDGLSSEQIEEALPYIPLYDRAMEILDEENEGSYDTPSTIEEIADILGSEELLSNELFNQIRLRKNKLENNDKARSLSSGRGIDPRQGDPEEVGRSLERLSQRSDDLGANFRYMRDLGEEEFVQFEYRGKMREVRPDPSSGNSLFQNMKTSKDGALYFVGIDSESGEVRSFRLDRINGLILGADYGGYDSGWDGAGFNDELPRALTGLGSGRRGMSSGRINNLPKLELPILKKNPNRDDEDRVGEELQQLDSNLYDQLQEIGKIGRQNMGTEAYLKEFGGAVPAIEEIMKNHDGDNESVYDALSEAIDRTENLKKRIAGSSPSRAGMSSGRYGEEYDPSKRDPSDYAQLNGEPHRPRWDGKSGQWVYDTPDDGTSKTRPHNWDTPDTPAEDHDMFWRDYVRIPYQELLAEYPIVAGEKSPAISSRVQRLAAARRFRIGLPFDGKLKPKRIRQFGQMSEDTTEYEKQLIAEAIAKDFSHSGLSVDELAYRFNATPLQIHDVLDSVAELAPETFDGDRRATDIPSPSREVQRLRRERIELAQEYDTALKTNKDIISRRSDLIAENPSTKRAKDVEALRISKQKLRLAGSSFETAEQDLEALRSEDNKKVSAKLKEMLGTDDERFIPKAREIFADNFWDYVDEEDDYEGIDTAKNILIDDYDLVNVLIDSGEAKDEDDARNIISDLELDEVADLVPEEEAVRSAAYGKARQLENALNGFREASSRLDTNDPAINASEEKNGSESIQLQEKAKNAVNAVLQDVDVPSKPRTPSSARGLSSGRSRSDSDGVDVGTVAGSVYSSTATTGMSSGLKFEPMGDAYKRIDANNESSLRDAALQVTEIENPEIGGMIGDFPTDEIRDYQLAQLEHALKVREDIAIALSQKYPEVTRGNNVANMSILYDYGKLNGGPLSDNTIDDLDTLNDFVNSITNEINMFEDRYDRKSRELEDANEVISDTGRELDSAKLELETARMDLDEGDIELDEYTKLVKEINSRVDELNQQLEEYEDNAKELEEEVHEAGFFGDGDMYSKARALEDSYMNFGSTGSPRNTRRTSLASGRREMMQDTIAADENNARRESLLDADMAETDRMYSSFMSRPSSERASAFASYRRETGKSPNPNDPSFKRWIAGLESDLIMREDSGEMSGRDSGRGLSSGRSRKKG